MRRSHFNKVIVVAAILLNYVSMPAHTGVRPHTALKYTRRARCTREAGVEILISFSDFRPYELPGCKLNNFCLAYFRPCAGTIVD